MRVVACFCSVVVDDKSYITSGGCRSEVVVWIIAYLSIASFCVCLFAADG